MGLIKLRLIITGGIFGSNSIAFTKNKTSERGQKNISQFLKKLLQYVFLLFMDNNNSIYS